MILAILINYSIPGGGGIGLGGAAVGLAAGTIMGAALTSSLSELKY